MAKPLENDAYQITWLIRRLFRAMAQKSGETLEPFDLTAADRAVMEFLADEEALSVPEIADKYSVSRQHVQVTVNRLLARGLLVSSDNPRHKRSVLISLTRQARSLFRKIRARDNQLVQQLFSEIPASDIRKTRATLENLLQKIQEVTGK